MKTAPKITFIWCVFSYHPRTPSPKPLLYIHLFLLQNLPCYLKTLSRLFCGIFLSLLSTYYHSLSLFTLLFSSSAFSYSFHFYPQHQPAGWWSSQPAIMYDTLHRRIFWPQFPLPIFNLVFYIFLSFVFSVTAVFRLGRIDFFFYLHLLLFWIFIA